MCGKENMDKRTEEKARKARAAYRREWYRQHRDERLAYNKEWRAKNRDKVKQYELKHWASVAERQAEAERSARKKGMA